MKISMVNKMAFKTHKNLGVFNRSGPPISCGRLNFKKMYNIPAKFPMTGANVLGPTKDDKTTIIQGR
jgi:hypothetical protein